MKVMFGDILSGAGNGSFSSSQWNKLGCVLRNCFYSPVILDTISDNVILLQQ
ncbi:hypothetical protein HPY86_05800 [candidate division WOR-3 bacterium]|nr:hypothetical protein [candidate division WOR-3 bacterium]